MKKTKMKILHVTNNFSEGGVETFLLTLLPALKNAGHDITLLVLDKNKAKLTPVIAQQGISVCVGKYNNVHDPRNIFLIRSFIRRGKYDIVHAHLFPHAIFCGDGPYFEPAQNGNSNYGTWQL
jgi:glycosyltransferase involved in cell wall biosynthesis